MTNPTPTIPEIATDPTDQTDLPSPSPSPPIRTCLRHLFPPPAIPTIQSSPPSPTYPSNHINPSTTNPHTPFPSSHQPPSQLNIILLQYLLTLPPPTLRSELRTWTQHAYYARYIRFTGSPPQTVGAALDVLRTNLYRTVAEERERQDREREMYEAFLDSGGWEKLRRDGEERLVVFEGLCRALVDKLDGVEEGEELGKGNGLSRDMNGEMREDPADFYMYNGISSLSDSLRTIASLPIIERFRLENKHGLSLDQLEDLDNILKWKVDFDGLWEGFVSAIRLSDVDRQNQGGKPWNTFLKGVERMAKGLGLVYVFRDGEWGDLEGSEDGEVDDKDAKVDEE